MHNHFTRIDTRLHRATEVDEASAPEGGIARGDWREKQGHPIHKVPRPKKVPRQRYRGLWLSLLWPAAFVAFVGLVAALWP